jgi:shikimate dehydrogenase
MVSGFGRQWVGVSVTMPGKFAALHFADERTPRAELVGSANTLVRIDGGWRADNTDVDGVTGALGSASGATIVIGSGGTARAAVVGLARLGVSSITVVARDQRKAEPVVTLGSEVGVNDVRWRGFADPELADEVVAASAVVSTIPAQAAQPHVGVFERSRVLLDAIYDPWPTPLAAAVAAAGGTVINGLEMLLNQAFTQVELFTGRPAPKEAMRAALG